MAARPELVEGSPRSDGALTHLQKKINFAGLPPAALTLIVGLREKTANPTYCGKFEIQH